MRRVTNGQFTNLWCLKSVTMRMDFDCFKQENWKYVWRVVTHWQDKELPKLTGCRKAAAHYCKKAQESHCSFETIPGGLGDTTSEATQKDFLRDRFLDTNSLATPILMMQMCRWGFAKSTRHGGLKDPGDIGKAQRFFYMFAERCRSTTARAQLKHITLFTGGFWHQWPHLPCHKERDDDIEYDVKYIKLNESGDMLATDLAICLNAVRSRAEGWEDICAQVTRYALAHSGRHISFMEACKIFASDLSGNSLMYQMCFNFAHFLDKEIWMEAWLYKGKTPSETLPTRHIDIKQNSQNLNTAYQRGRMVAKYVAGTAQYMHALEDLDQVKIGKNIFSMQMDGASLGNTHLLLATMSKYDNCLAWCIPKEPVACSLDLGQPLI